MPMYEKQKRPTARKGTPQFAAMLAELRGGYVYGHFPGLRGYAYQADWIRAGKARGIMEAIVKRIVEIDWPIDEHPWFRLEGETGWRSVADSEDFPQPSAEGPEGYEEEEED